MKRKWKIVIFVLLFTCLYIYLCFIFTPKTVKDYGGENYYGVRLYECEKENTINCVAIGNSDLYSSFIPPYLYEKYGITSFGCGTSWETLGMGYSLLKGIKKEQDIKLLIIEADFIYETRLKGAVEQELGAFRFIASPFVYHSKWKKLKVSDFYKMPTKDVDLLKGYKFHDKIVKAKKRNYMVEKDNISIPSSNMSKLKEMIKYCERNDIKILMYEAPSMTSWNLTKSMQVSKLCADNNIPFIDFNLILEKINFNDQKHYRDNGNHLNIYGAKIITDYLGEYISNNFEIDDHRGDQNYQNWEEAVEYFNSKIKKE